MTKFIYTLFRVGVIFICLVCAQANAEQNTGAGAATDAGSKDVTVTVTRTSEGVIVITPDGRRVLLRDDHTWEVIETEQGDAASSAVITVANVRGLRNACKVGLRLENKLGYNIKSLIPSFSAHTSKGVLYETVQKHSRPLNLPVTSISRSSLSVLPVKVSVISGCMVPIIALWGRWTSSTSKRASASVIYMYSPVS